MKMNGFLIGILSIVTGAVIGGLVADATQGITWLRWLAYGTEFGISTAEPFLLDLVVLKISIGFMVSVNLASVIGMILALLIYRKIIN